VGAALALLVWGAGWASWLPLTGVHRAPWTERTPKVLLPVVDHAVFGAAWGLANWAVSGRARDVTNGYKCVTRSCIHRRVCYDGYVQIEAGNGLEPRPVEGGHRTWEA